MKAAEAEAEAAYYAGTGIARQRQAIVDGTKLHSLCCVAATSASALQSSAVCAFCPGMRESVETFQKDVKGVTSAEVMKSKTRDEK